MVNLNSRLLLPEMMDDPTLPASELEIVLKALRRINLLSFTTSFLTFPIIEICRRKNIRQPLVVDIGCGDGWVLSQVVQKLCADGYSAKGIGLDSNHISTNIAKENFKQKNLTFLTRPASMGFDDLKADFIISSLFLHHLSSLEIVNLLLNAAKNVRGGIVMVDLRRSISGLILAFMGTRLVTFSSIVHNDSVQSVNAGFNFQEFKELVDSAGLVKGRIEKIFLSRLRLVWEASTS